MINVYSMDDETNLAVSLATNLDHSPNSSSNLSKSDVMSGNHMIDNWCKFCIHFNIKSLLNCISCLKIKIESN